MLPIEKLGTVDEINTIVSPQSAAFRHPTTKNFLPLFVSSSFATHLIKHGKRRDRCPQHPKVL